MAGRIGLVETKVKGHDEQSAALGLWLPCTYLGLPSPGLAAITRHTAKFRLRAPVCDCLAAARCFPFPAIGRVALWAAACVDVTRANQ